MNERERIWFEALTKDREESARTFEKPSMRGAMDGAVEKYSDQAHFVYELLQNADDAGATLVRFSLHRAGLVFSHNGSRHFTLTDPAKEGEGAVGDINAITSIGNSSKKGKANKIGKFGVGFKAVFQYTTEPSIYDRDFRFKIKRLVVPELREDDFPGRQPDDTLFELPFNHPERDRKAAYDDISEKLKKLSFPLLFLSHLERIEFESVETRGKYEKRIESTRNFDNGNTAELVCLIQSVDKKEKKERLWLFSREIEDGDGHRYKCSVGFFLDEKKRLCAPEHDIPAFCFFPTKENTGLNFIIHAPFLLTDSREGIRADAKHNRDMVDSLAELAADAIFHLKEIGEEKSLRLVDDSIVDIIPYELKRFSDIDDKSRISFLPFYNEILQLFKTREIIPTRDGYTTVGNAYWASVQKLTELFSDKQLGEICSNENAHWVFVTKGRDATPAAKEKYIGSLVRTFVDEDAIINGRTGEHFYDRTRGEWRSHERVRGITPQFIQAQSFSWLHEFYAWLYETKKRTDAACKQPVFLNQNKEAVAVVDAIGQPTLFLPSEEVDENTEGYNFVHPALLQDKKTREFVQSIGVKEPSLHDYIYNIILPQYAGDENVDIDIDPHFKLFFKHYCEGSAEEREQLVNQIKNCEFLKYHYNKGDPQTYRGAAGSMYLPTPELQEWFETKPRTRFIALDEYKEIAGIEKEKQLLKFFEELGVKSKVSLLSIDVSNEQAEEDICSEV